MRQLVQTPVFGWLLAFASLTASANSTLPTWLDKKDLEDKALVLQIPQALGQIQYPSHPIDYLILQLDPDWTTNWKEAAFALKALIVDLKTKGVQVRVGMEGTEDQVQELLAHELAPYVDGYLFTDAPFIPDGDPSGKLWQRVGQLTDDQILETLLDASSIGVQLVLFENQHLTQDHRDLLSVIQQTRTGSLDLQPQIEQFPNHRAHFFFDPGSGNYHLAIYATNGEIETIGFPFEYQLSAELIFPERVGYRFNQEENRVTLKLLGQSSYYFFQLTPTTPTGATETLQIVAAEQVDPYELVVLNQVFKDRESKKFRSLIVDESINYRYQSPQGASVDITFIDEVYLRKHSETERVRKELYISGAKWPYKDLPKLPLIQPEKIRVAPLVIDLDKSYNYSYEGEDLVDSHATWKVGFQPKESGDYMEGTVWIDKETGAHRKLRAVQSGLKAPVTGNEVTAYFDWIDDGNQKYWVQRRERNLQLWNIIGERVALQIDTDRFNYRFNRKDVSEQLQIAHESSATILRDTAEGLRYLEKKGGRRVVSQESYDRKKFLLGGILVDPNLDQVIPLAGLDYTNFNFMGRGYQTNLLIAGAINDLIISNPNFMGRNWDFTAELFASAIYFEDNIYENGQEREELAVKSIRESLNLSLGIPLSSFWKFTLNYGLRYWDFKKADETASEFVLPSSHLEHTARFRIQFDRKRFATELEYETSNRSKWDAWGLPGNETVFHKKFQKIRFDTSITKRAPNFRNYSADLRYLKGWDLDRFSRFKFGFLENNVSGFGSSGIEADEAVRLRLGNAYGVKGLFQLDFTLDAARAWVDQPSTTGQQEAGSAVDLIGFGAAVNMIGPWKTIIRANLGYGIDSDLEDEAGHMTAQIFFLKLW